MVRLLLTLLALMTGLSAPVSAAEARGARASEVMVNVAAGEANLAAPRANAAIPAVRPGTRIPPCAVIMLHRDVRCAPPVQLRSDRARE